MNLRTEWEYDKLSSHSSGWLARLGFCLCGKQWRPHLRNMASGAGRGSWGGGNYEPPEPPIRMLWQTVKSSSWLNNSIQVTEQTHTIDATDATDRTDGRTKGQTWAEHKHKLTFMISPTSGSAGVAVRSVVVLDLVGGLKLAFVTFFVSFARLGPQI